MKAALQLTVVALSLVSLGAFGQEHMQPERLAEQAYLDRCDLSEVTIQGVIEFLNGKAQENLSAPRRTRIEYTAPKIPSEARVTVFLSHIALLDVLKVASAATGLELSATDDAIYLHPPGEPPLQTSPTRPIQLDWSNRTTAALTGLIQATAERDGFLNASRLFAVSLGRTPANQASFDLLKVEVDRCEKRRSQFNRLLQDFLSQSKPKNE